MAMGNPCAQALATSTAPAQTGHLGREAGLINEHQPGRVEIELILKPRLTRGADVGPVLLGRVRGFF